MRFIDRADAGRQLALAVAELLPLLQPDAEGRENNQTLVLAVPKGGIPVAVPIAQALHAPLDVWLTKKLSAPGNREFAIGSVSIDGGVYLDEALIDALRIPQEYIATEIEQKRSRLQEEAHVYRHENGALDVRGRNVVLVDDGIATGATALAALAALRRAGAKRRIFATPVAPLQAVERLELMAENLVVLKTPRHFEAVGQFYDDFSPLALDEVAALLSSYHASH